MRTPHGACAGAARRCRAGALAAWVLTLLAAAPGGAHVREAPGRSDVAFGERGTLGPPCTGMARIAAAPVDPSDDRDLDVLHYDLAIDVGESSISGVLELEAVPLVDGLSEVVLDLYDTYAISSLESPSHGVTQTTRADDFLTIELATPAALSDTIRIEITYEGTPPIVSGYVTQPPFTWSTHGNPSAPVIFTLSVPNRSGTWWPCKEQLEDKATIDLACTVADTLVVASNGVLVDTVPAGPGRATYRWSHTTPILPYLVCLSISNYVLLHDSATIDVDGAPEVVPIEYYVYGEHVSAATFDFERVPEAMEFYSATFGPYPFWREKYAMAEINWSGGMEHQTCVSLGSRFVTGTRSEERVYVHELAHQWFGDWVAVRRLEDIWMNEGFATYCEALWAEHLGGADAYTARMIALDPFPPPRYRDFLGTIWDPSPLYGETPYNKGAWVLHMLRFAVGDEAFFEILRTYVSERGGGNGSTEEFQAIAEAISGRPLATFFDQWLRHPGRPYYALRWDTGTEGGVPTTHLTVQQQQPAVSVYEMPIQIGLVTESGTEYTVIENTEREETFTLTSTTPVTGVLFDPNLWILRPTELFTYEAPAVAASFRAVLPNPMTTEAAIRYRVNVGGPVRLRIFDVAGRFVRTLVDREELAQDHVVVWDGRDDAGAEAAKGVYFLELVASGARERRSLTKID